MIFDYRVFTWICLFCLLPACGGDRPSHKDMRDDLQEARFTKMLDEKKYSDVIAALAPRANENSRWKVLLGQAQLGMAGFEPLLIASKTTGPQTTFFEPLEVLIPRCANTPLTQFSTIEVPCVLKRLIQHLPAPQNPHLQQGLNTLKQAYPNAETAPKRINFLVGLVELSLAVSYLGSLMISYDQMDATTVTDEMIQSLFGQSLLVANHADQSLYRARFTEKNIASSLTGIGRFEIMDLSGSSKTGYRPGSGFPELIGIADPSNRSLEVKLLRAMVIQNLDRVVEGFKRR